MGFDFYFFNITNDKKLELKEEKQDKIKEIKERMSPKRKLMKKNESWENFIKLSWAWTA